MAYFPNASTPGAEAFDDLCSRCRFGGGQVPCPIWMAQQTYNYEAANNEVATAILGMLVTDDGACQMFALDPELFLSDTWLALSVT